MLLLHEAIAKNEDATLCDAELWFLVWSQLILLFAAKGQALLTAWQKGRLSLYSSLGSDVYVAAPTQYTQWA